MSRLPPVVPVNPAGRPAAASFASRFKAELLKLLAQLAVKY
ncbi:hypothetical protein [Massilia sp. PWRC2]